MMGLDICCQCGQIDFRAGSYCGFNSFRTKLARIYKIDLSKMSGFGGRKRWTKKEPFFELLYHSDCDDILNPLECKNLLKDFKNYLQSRKSFFNPSERHSSLNEEIYFHSKMLLWYDAVKHSVKNNCSLKFQ